MTHDRDETPERRSRLDQIIGAYLEAVDAGEAPDTRDWQDRHPDLNPELAEFFADQDRIRAWVEPLRAEAPAEAGRADASALDPGAATSPPTEPEGIDSSPTSDPGATAIPPPEPPDPGPDTDADPYATVIYSPRATTRRTTGPTGPRSTTSATTRCSRSWAKAAWASSSRPARSASTAWSPSR
jgi:hypothetical protein